MVVLAIIGMIMVFVLIILFVLYKNGYYTIDKVEEISKTTYSVTYTSNPLIEDTKILYVYKYTYKNKRIVFKTKTIVY